MGNVMPEFAHKRQIDVRLSLLTTITSPSSTYAMDSTGRRVSNRSRWARTPLRLGGGGASSSNPGGEGNSELDFASVQRDNAEMQRRCQQVRLCTMRMSRN